MTHWTFAALGCAACLVAAGVGPPPQPGGAPRPPAEGDATVEAPEAEPAEKREERRRRLRPAFDLAPVAEMDPEKRTFGATRAGADDPVRLLAPRLGKLLGAAAHFEWETDAAGGVSVLVISDEAGTPVVQAETDGLAIAPDPPAGGWRPGRTYSWKVFFRRRPSPLFSQPSRFVVVSEEERAQIEEALDALPAGGSYEGDLARARLLRDRGLWHDTLGAYSDLIGRYPDRRELYEERGGVYWQIEAARERAERDFERADGLAVKKGKGSSPS